MVFVIYIHVVTYHLARLCQHITYLTIFNFKLKVLKEVKSLLALQLQCNMNLTNYVPITTIWQHKKYD